jgi:tetratricopeptide (TPR) repeat protein
VELLRDLVKDFPDVPDYRLDLCETLGRPRPPAPSDGVDNAPKAADLEEAVALSEKLVKDYPNVPDYAAAHVRYLNFLGIHLFQEGIPDEAETRFRQALAEQRRLNQKYPAGVAYVYRLGRIERNLGKVLSEQGQWQEALSLLESSIARMETLPKDAPYWNTIRPFLGQAYRDLARVYTHDGDTARTAEAQRKAAELDPDHIPDPLNPRSFLP